MNWSAYISNQLESALCVKPCQSQAELGPCSLSLPSMVTWDLGIQNFLLMAKSGTSLDTVLKEEEQPGVETLPIGIHISVHPETDQHNHSDNAHRHL